MTSPVDVQKMFEEINNTATEALQAAKTITVTNSNSKGISLLEAKNHLMVQYMQDLCLLMKNKVSGKPIRNHPAIWRLVVNRTYLEKIQPIEKKLKYQITKLVRRHRFGDAGGSDPLKFRPNLDNFGEGSNEDESDDEEEEEKKKKNAVYRAPKLAPVHYDGDETLEQRSQHKLERLKKRALSSTMLEELKRDLLDEPEEIRESSDLHRLKADRKRKERDEYEEEFFVRTSVPKKEKIGSRRMSTMSSLEGILKMDSLAALDDNATLDEPYKKKRKGLKGKGKKGKGKSKGKKRIH